MKSIWNGFDTNPHTLANGCAICSGAAGGDFLKLPCGHGSADLYPMHVSCIIQSLAPIEGDQATPPRCPVCRAPIDMKTLAGLADYITQNKAVTFPDENGIRREEPLCPAPEQKKAFLDLVVNAHEAIPGGSIEMEDHEDRAEYYDSMIAEADQLIDRIREGTEEHIYSLEDLDQAGQELEAIKNRITSVSGRVALLDHSSWAIIGADFGEIYEKLLMALRRLQEIDDRLRKEREEKQREEEHRHKAHVS